MVRHNIGAFTTFNADISPNEKQLSQFSENNDINNIELPLKVKGTLITAGEYSDRKYGKVTVPKEELKKSVPDWKGVRIFKSHEYYKKLSQNESIDVDGVIGKIIEAQWNENDSSITFTGLIYNENVARNILAEITNEISVGFMNNVVLEEGVYKKKDIDPKELSMVLNPRDKNASISPA